MRIKLFTFLLIIVFALPSIFSLLHPGFFQSDDGEWMIIRFSAFHQALRDGQFPVRWLGRLNHEYGYPVSNFLYPGFMYIAEPIHLIGFNFINTIKIVSGISMVGSALFSFLWLSRFFDNRAAFIGALFYLYTPYHLYDLYKRGSIGEILSLTVIPFVFWQIERKSFFWLTISIAFLIISHNTLALLFLPLILLYIAIHISASVNKLQQIYKYTSILVLSLGLSAFFWVPALFELSYTKFSEIKVSDVQNYFSSLNLIGVSSLVVLLISVFFLYKIILKSKFNIDNKLLIFFTALGILSIILSSSISFSVWNIFSSSLIQFPFRLLSYLILSVSFLAAFIVFQLAGIRKYVISFIFILLLGISTLPFISPLEFFNKEDTFYSTNEGTTTVRNEYMPRWVKIFPASRPLDKIDITNGKITDLKASSNLIKFKVNSERVSKVKINMIYFPGWNARINGEISPLSYNNDQGIIEVNVPSGVNIVEAKFTETPLRLLGDIISIVSLIVLFILTVKNGKRNKTYEYIKK